MALSNLIWWPWFGRGLDKPPVDGDEQLMGGIRPQQRRSRVGEDPDEEELIVVVLLSSLD